MCNLKYVFCVCLSQSTKINDFWNLYDYTLHSKNDYFSLWALTQSSKLQFFLHFSSWHCLALVAMAGTLTWGQQKCCALIFHPVFTICLEVLFFAVFATIIQPQIDLKNNMKKNIVLVTSVSNIMRLNKFIHWSCKYTAIFCLYIHIQIHSKSFFT